MWLGCKDVAGVVVGWPVGREADAEGAAGADAGDAGSDCISLADAHVYRVAQPLVGAQLVHAEAAAHGVGVVGRNAQIADAVAGRGVAGVNHVSRRCGCRRSNCSASITPVTMNGTPMKGNPVGHVFVEEIGHRVTVRRTATRRSKRNPASQHARPPRPAGRWRRSVPERLRIAPHRSRSRIASSCRWRGCRGCCSGR